MPMIQSFDSLLPVVANPPVLLGAECDSLMVRLNELEDMDELCRVIYLPFSS